MTAKEDKTKKHISIDLPASVDLSTEQLNAISKGSKITDTERLKIEIEHAVEMSHELHTKYIQRKPPNYKKEMQLLEEHISILISKLDSEYIIDHLQQTVILDESDEYGFLEKIEDDENNITEAFRYLQRRAHINRIQEQLKVLHTMAKEAKSLKVSSVYSNGDQNYHLSIFMELLADSWAHTFGRKVNEGKNSYGYVDFVANVLLALGCIQEKSKPILNIIRYRTRTAMNEYKKYAPQNSA